MNSLCSAHSHGFHKTNAVVASGPVPLVLYSFNGSSGTSLLNNATGVSDGTMSSGSCISTAQDSTGSGYSFAVLTSNYANCTSSPTYPITVPSAVSGNGFTCSFWYKGSSYTSGSPVNVVIGGLSHYFWIDGNSTSPHIAWKGDSFWGDTGGIGSQNIFDGNWHFFCGVCLYTSTTTATVYQYFDNTIINSCSSSMPSGTATLRINSYNSAGSYNMNNGYIDNVRYYNIPLSDSQIATLNPSPPFINNYNFASPTVSNNSYTNVALIAASTPGAFTTTQNMQWSWTSGNNPGSFQLLLCLGTHALCSSALNFPSTNSQYICCDIAERTGSGTTWCMMYQNLIFPAGTRTVTWYMCTSDTAWSWCSGSYVTASVGGISGATQNYTTISNSWVQKSFTFTVPTAGTYPLQFTTGVTNPTGYAISNMGCFVIT